MSCLAIARVSKSFGGLRAVDGVSFAIDEAHLLSRLLNLLKRATYRSVCKAGHEALPWAFEWGRQTGNGGRRLGSEGAVIPPETDPNLPCQPSLRQAKKWW